MTVRASGCGAELMPNTRKILIVDDDPELRDALTEQLSLEFEAVAVENGTKGVQAAKTGQIDLVIMDVGLPDIDGREAVRILRKNGFKAPIIMLTGHDTDSDALDESGKNLLRLILGRCLMVGTADDAILFKPATGRQHRSDDLASSSTPFPDNSGGAVRGVAAIIMSRMARRVANRTDRAQRRRPALQASRQCRHQEECSRYQPDDDFTAHGQGRLCAGSTRSRSP